LYDGPDQDSDEKLGLLTQDSKVEAIIPPEFLTYRHVFQVEEKQEYWTEGAKSESIDILHSNTSVFIIDPQMDFHRGGSFPIDGAVEDSQRIASMIKTNKFFIHNIFVALDTHYEKHITHASFWRDKYGNKPSTSTKISYSDIKSGTWIPREEEDLEWCLKYTKDLERKGRLKLTICPEHCIIGTRGHAVVPVINDALQEWALYSKRPIQYVFKGFNYRTEMYSALEAEVVDPNDYTTSLNEELLSMLRISDKVFMNYFKGLF
jgi:nicotinamidase-related amidase